MKRKTIQCLVKKDFKNCFLNKNIALMLAIPIFFCFLYGMITPNPTSVLLLCSIFAISIIPTTVLPMMIAEEKEKNTLRALMLANVSASEFLCAKAFVCVCLTLVDAILIFLITKADITLFFIYICIVILCTSSLLLLGALMGLFSKDQTAAGTIAAPLMLLVMMPPLLSDLHKVMENLSKLVPTTSFKILLYTNINDGSLLHQDSMLAIIVCLIWLLAGWIIFNIMYKRIGLDK